MTCSNCDREIVPGDIYATILGDVYCRDCMAEYVHDEIEENFDNYADQLADILGIHTFICDEF